MFQFTPEQHETLRLFIEARNVQNWGFWPEVSTWPVPAEAGAFSASQYNNNATVIKFDRSVKLANGVTSKKIGTGATRRMAGVAYMFPVKLANV